MKQLLTSKTLRKFMILSCLITGVVFAASDNKVQAGSTQCITCEERTVGLGGHNVNILIGPNNDYTDCVYYSYWVEDPQPQPETSYVTYCDTE